MKYDLSYDPPAPALDVTFFRPLSTNSLELRAKVDTGADISVIPQHVINALGLLPVRRISVSSFDGHEEWKYTHFVDLSFYGFKFPMVEMVGARRRDALLGRDVLNRLKSILDGKTLSLDLFDP